MQRNYTGYSGQMAVMSELLFRKCNAAVPVIDIGMDVFAFHDDREDVARIQVKAAQATPYRQGGGYRAQFNISMKQLRATDEPPLYYTLAARLEDKWVSFLVIGRSRLREYWEGSRPFGIENHKSGDLALPIKYRPQIGAPDNYFGAWDQLPPLRPATAVTAPGEPLKA